MQSRRKKLTCKSMGRLLTSGFGQGEETSYHLHLRVSDAPSSGTCSIIGWKNGREHRHLSCIERSYFYCVEWLDGALEIREQFPFLPLESAYQIAKSIGVLQ